MRPKALDRLTAPRPVNTQAQRPTSILIIDDEPIQLRAMVAELDALGFETLIARNGADGIAKAGRGRPDLILLDILMPGLDGYQTCRRLKADPATRMIPVIFLSALSASDEKVRGFEAGGIDYITKPFDQRELLARIGAHLQQHRLLIDLANTVASPQASNATGADVGPGAAPAAPRAVDRGLRFVYQAMDILLAEMRSPPSRIDLARRIGTNQSSLGHAFRKHLGMTIFEFLREQRLARAQTLLATGTQPIQQIADTIGFKHTGDFATAFKRRFGLTPREYRQRHGQT